MMDTTISPQPPIACCHCDEQTFTPCVAEAVYRTYYRGILVEFCELHYREWIVVPILDGTLDPALVSATPPLSPLTLERRAE